MIPGAQFFSSLEYVSLYFEAYCLQSAWALCSSEFTLFHLGLRPSPPILDNIPMFFLRKYLNEIIALNLKSKIASQVKVKQQEQILRLRQDSTL